LIQDKYILAILPKVEIIINPIEEQMAQVQKNIVKKELEILDR
jgi:hypothetical protein